MKFLWILEITWQTKLNHIPTFMKNIWVVHLKNQCSFHILPNEEMNSIISTFGDTASGWDDTAPRSVKLFFHLSVFHYDDVIMGAIASQITSLTIVYSIVYSDADQRKHQSSASLAFVRGIHRGPVNSPHKWPVTRKMLPFDDVIMWVTVVVCEVRCVTYLIKLHIILKRIARSILGEQKYYPSHGLFEELDVVSIYDINKCSLGTFCYRLHFGLLPDIFKNFFT